MVARAMRPTQERPREFYGIELKIENVNQTKAIVKNGVSVFAAESLSAWAGPKFERKRIPECRHSAHSFGVDSARIHQPVGESI